MPVEDFQQLLLNILKLNNNKISLEENNKKNNLFYIKEHIKCKNFNIKA